MIIQIYNNKGQIERIIKIEDYETPQIEELTKRILYDIYDCTIIDNE